MSDRIVAIDLFAGTGWGVACKSLGIDEVGVELMPEARATREANGMTNWLSDVWDVLENADPDSPEFKAAMLIASPPCQSFSMAGNGAGRRALDEVLGLIDSGAYLDVAELREFGERHDIRTALVLTPLAYAAKHRPAYVVLEQVPPVLPVWERMAVELRGWGYSVVTGILHAEAFGVPQTRKRAILIARADGVEARMPTPTHSRYYPRDKTRMDLGVLPWVSMAEALGWGMTGRPHFTLTSGGSATGGYEPFPTGARNGIEREHEAGRWMHAVTGDPINLDPSLPATTVAGDRRLTSREHHAHGEQNSTSTKVTVAEAAALQSYPVTGWGFVDRPALTVTGHGLLTRQPTGQREAVARSVESGSFITRPPFTTETARKEGPQREDYLSLSDRYEPDAVNASPAENAILQAYPDGFVFAGSRTKQFLQIGNAVPPLLARAVLATIIDETKA